VISEKKLNSKRNVSLCKIKISKTFSTLLLIENGPISAKTNFATVLQHYLSQNHSKTASYSLYIRGL